MNPLRSEPNLILPCVVKDIEYLLNLLLLLERLSCYCYNALPAISVYICYYNRTKQKKQTNPKEHPGFCVLNHSCRLQSHPVTLFGGP